MPKTAPKTGRTPGRRNRRASTGPEGHQIDRQRQRTLHVGAAPRAPSGQQQQQQQHYTIRGSRPQARPPLTPSPPAAEAVVVSSSTDDPESSPIRHRHRRSPAASPASNYLLEALQRIRALQDELDFLENDPYAEDTDDDELNDEAEPGEDVQAVICGEQAEAIGWAVCAREAIQFLHREGIPADSPLMLNLRRRLIGTAARPSDGADEGLSC